jgi:hypothetical protein
MQIERDDVEAALERKGFVRKDDKDHRKFHFWTSDRRKTAIWTKTSRGTDYKTLQDGLIAMMAKQMKLTKKEFGDFVACDIERGRYEELLAERKEL